jgi:hypothetical protein
MVCSLMYNIHSSPQQQLKMMNESQANASVRENAFDRLIIDSLV